MLGKYDIVMRMARGIVLAASALAPDESTAKFMRYGRGQRRAAQIAEETCAALPEDRPTVWVHCSSMGEYGIARPIISAVKQRMECNVVLTFFSPTGYEAVSRRPGDADAVLYMPLDTSRNVRRFLDAVRPRCAVFMVSEYWHNYLHELRERGVPTLLVSAIVREDSAFFRWYGGLYRDSLHCFTRIFALDSATASRIGSLGVGCATVNGDPLFDNAVLVARTPWSQPELERFAAGRRVFVAGSLHPDEDLDIVADLANANPDVPFIIVPHEIKETMLKKVRDAIEGEVLMLSECGAQTDFSHTRALVVDSVGSLAYLYRLGTWAYVGGGFTRLLHSVIEPVVYGLPVAFGPRTMRKVTPAQLEALGIGARVGDADALRQWFAPLKEDTALLASISRKAEEYVRQNTGATARVADAIIEATCTKD